MTAPEPGASHARLIREGETCWRRAPAHRIAFLVDGEAYFSALADALERAQEAIWLVGWDFHTSVQLRRDGRSDELVPLLEQLVRSRRSLRVRVLAWDFAMLYALERQFLPMLQFGARTHRRIHFAMDSTHPLNASQHQKLVVIDGALAFSGGFDLTTHRWDTREHRPDDPRRVTPKGQPYPPFHDVQVVVDGAAAAALEGLARQRWLRATGQRVSRVGGSPDPWPPALAPKLRDVEVGIARTLPSVRGKAEVREVEALYRESIAAARKSIYIENQYLTSPHITDWLAARLAEREGPEIVIVGPRGNAGWLEESTMGSLRDRMIRRLRDADAEDRLRVLYPDHDALAQVEMINVHSKVMVVDDGFARVGSSNLSNRSLGLDTECDLAIEALGREDVRRAIASFRNDLIAEHLGTDEKRVAREIERNGSLVRAVDALRGGPRTLEPIEIDTGDWAAEAVDALGAVDPEHPAPLEELVERFGEEGDSAVRPGGGRAWKAGLAAAALVGLGLAWTTTPLAEWTSAERLSEFLASVRQGREGPLIVFGLFTLAALLLVPVTALTVAAGLTLGPGLGILVAWSGSVAAAALGHAAGNRLWRESVRRLAGNRLNTLSRRLGQRGVLSSALLRVVPVAPFMVVNLVAGASHVALRDFVVGTALGMLPGTVLLVLGAHGIASMFGTGSAGPVWLWAALGAFALVAAVAGLRRAGAWLLDVRSRER